MSENHAPVETGAQATPREDRGFVAADAEKRLLNLQQQLRALKVPVVILLEGWYAAGKAAMAGELLEGLDPRGYEVHVPALLHGEKDGPDFRRYWVRMPRQGCVSLFIGGWYEPVCERAVRKHGADLPARLERANRMERMLACDGVLLLKFFIEIPRKVQKRRLRALNKRYPADGAGRRQNERYDEWQSVYRQMLSLTNDSAAVWHVLNGEDKRACKRRLYEIVISAFERVVAERREGLRAWDVPALGGLLPVSPQPMPRLSDISPDAVLKGDYKAALSARRKRLRKLQYRLLRRGISMALVFEGWDAAGKGGCIRRLTSALDPRGFTVTPVAAPTQEEKEHHHLWRFWLTLPGKGRIAIYDRSWYGRVLVERLEGFCTEAQWRRAYDELNLFEDDLVQSGMIVRKFWLHIDPDEQLKRFLARRDDPDKRWKITDEDWRNREKWPQYEQAVNEMLRETSTVHAPWVVVEANDKRFARLKVLDTVIAAVEERLNQ